MTHFNHDWDTTKTPAVPVSIGDRYYAQDLNDDFNYLKHLPYEVFLQGRSRGVMVAPNDTWNNSANTLTLSGGFGVVLQDCIELDPNEGFTIPPKTHSSPRYERVSFTNTTLVIPADNTIRYIVATPTKRSLLQRAKILFTEQYASRVRYDGIITIQDTAPTAGQILVGLCCNKEYCLLADNDPNQCKDNIILKKWFGENKITQGFVPTLQSYYNTSIVSIETKITINNVSGSGISGTLNHCSITIGTVSSGRGINGGTLNNCDIKINTVSGSKNSYGISNSTLNHCSITIDTVSSGSGINGTFNNCSVKIGTVGGDSYGINNSTFSNCDITIDTVSNGRGINKGTFNDCSVKIGEVSGNYGINDGTFSTCAITIGTVSSGIGINGGTFNNCDIKIGEVSGSYGTYGGTFSTCAITIGTVNSSGIGNGTFSNCSVKIDIISSGINSNYGIYNNTFNNCSIKIDVVSNNVNTNYGISNNILNNCSVKIGTVGGDSYGINNSTFSNCDITIDTVSGYGIDAIYFINCSIKIGKVNSGGSGISDNSGVAFYLTRIECTAVTGLSNTNGKLNVLNDTIFHAS